MFLMSSPGNNTTPRRESRVIQGYPHVNGLRPGSMLRENSDGWGVGRVVDDVDLDITDAEDLAAHDEEVREEILPLPRARNTPATQGNRRRSNSDLARYSQSKIRQQHGGALGQGFHSQDRVSKAGAGTAAGAGGVSSGAKRKLGQGGVGGVSNGERRRLAPGFAPG